MKILLSLGQRVNNEYDDIYDPSGVTTPRQWILNCANNEASLIHCKIIDYIAHLPDFLDHLISKLRSGGSLILEGTNANEVNRLFYLDKISIEEYNRLVYGQSELDIFTKKSIYEPVYIKNLLVERQLQITEVKLAEHIFIIKAIR